MRLVLSSLLQSFAYVGVVVVCVVVSHPLTPLPPPANVISFTG